MARAYTSYRTTSSTPQSCPIPGREPEMTPNSAGGYGFALGDWERLWRFLIIGSENGTYYVSEKTLTAQNAGAVIRCLKVDGPRAVELARDVSVNNRAPKTDQQLFVLALALQHGDAATKQAVFKAMPQMVRTGTHLLHLVAMLDSLGGWNRTKRLLVKRWLNDDANQVAFQALKYQQRDGWSQRDVLRVVHPKPRTEAHQETFAWIVGKHDSHSLPKVALPSILIKYQAMVSSEASPLERALRGIEGGLPREALPTEVLQHPEVQRALLPSLPLHALLRNLGNLSSDPKVLRDEDVELISQKLTDSAALRRSRVHPFAILLATLVYRGGHGLRGSKSWNPDKVILSALEDAYDLAFDTTTPTGKKIIVAVDVSGSMSMHNCVGTPIKASTAAAAMALTLARLEPRALALTFDTAVVKTLVITKRSGIASIENARGGGTDVAAPITWALAQKREVDAFVILTDNETWHGKSHPTEALVNYRRLVNPRAKLICCSMASNAASVVDPFDPLQLGTAGLDANLPSIAADFINS